jgi:hypothetical protein
VSCTEGDSLLVFGWAPLTEHAGGNLEEEYQLTQADEDILGERDHGGRRASEWEQGIYGDEAGTGPGEQQKRQISEVASLTENRPSRFRAERLFEFVDSAIQSLYQRTSSFQSRRASRTGFLKAPIGAEVRGPIAGLVMPILIDYG